MGPRFLVFVMARYTRKPVDLMALMQQNSVLHGQQQAEIVRQLNTELLSIVQQEKLTFCRVNRIKAGRVQILCSSAGWATRLKMQSPAILTRFRQNVLPDCAGIDIEVNPNLQVSYQQAAAPAVSSAPQISEQGAAYLLAAAEHMDPLLAEKLRKLAALAGNNSR